MDTHTRMVLFLTTSILFQATGRIASAQEPPLPRDGMGHIRGFAGIFFPVSDEPLSGYLAGEEASVSPLYGLGGGYYPRAYLGFEGEIAAAYFPAVIGAHPDAYAISPRVQAVLALPRRLSPFILVGGGAQLYQTVGGVEVDQQQIDLDTRATVHWGAGLNFLITRNINLRLDGRHNLAFGASDIGQQIETFASLGFTFGGKSHLDTDRDGVPIPRDKCPEKIGFTTPDGCPDSDNDGLSDIVDICPKNPGRTKDGCPDRDNDNVVDHRDECPSIAGELANGCPNPDSDGDGIKNDDDRCPDVRGVSPSGCPNQDGDALVDIDDQCPTEPEVVNGYKDNDGCPDKLPKVVKRFTGTIRGIRFAPGRARIRRSSFKVLNEAVFVLKQYPELRLIVEGHTDSSGSSRSNLSLSKKRAEAVKLYFVENGIEPERITALGMGETNPIAPNTTAQGRQRNRRIKFRLLNQG